MTLSVCLIAKDEEETIARALQCAKRFADEIVVADTGSTDRTVEIAKRFTGNVCYFEWCDDFSAARNFAFSKASCDYVMWLDADDVIADEDGDKIKALMKDASFDIAFLPYAASFDGDTPSFVYYRERIFKRSKGFRFTGAVHEAVAPQGEIVYADALVCHRKTKQGDGMRNLKIYQKQLARGVRLDARAQFYYGRELFFNGMLPESAAVLERFLKGDGWVENKIEACKNLYSVYTALGQRERAMQRLLASFVYAPPRSWACCFLGDDFFRRKDVPSAIFWYQRALECDNGEKRGAFVNADYSGFIPLMQLCVLYDGLGEHETAAAYNERAGRLKPNAPAYLFNKAYFQTKLNKRENDDKT